MKKHKPVPKPKPAAAPETRLFEAEVVPGLEAFAAAEIRQRFADNARLDVVQQNVSGAVRFRYAGPLRALDSLRSVQAVYEVRQFPITRPKALLGDENFRVVINTIKNIQQAYSFKTATLSAAGSHTSIMQRILHDIGTQTGLKPQSDEGDLLLRIRPTPTGDGWEVLTRLTPRPLATRYWRVCNFEGAVNGTVSHVMTLLSNPTESDTVVNLGSGSGSLLVERGLWGRAGQLIGVEWDGDVMGCARQNIEAAKLSKRITLLRGDITRLPMASQSADVLLADLPFGQRVGSHRDNKSLYPKVFAEAARIAQTGARFIVITHEVRLIESLLATSTRWQTEQAIRITLRGLHPRIYVLRRGEVKKRA